MVDRFSLPDDPPDLPEWLEQIICELEERDFPQHICDQVTFTITDYMAEKEHAQYLVDKAIYDAIILNNWFADSFWEPYYFWGDMY